MSNVKLASPYPLVVAFVLATITSVPLGMYKLNVIDLPVTGEPVSSMKSAVALILVLIPVQEFDA